MFRISKKQLAALDESRSVYEVDRVETYLRKHYPEDCSQYRREVLREWIMRNLAEMKVRGIRSRDDFLLNMSTRWVLRAWFGDLLAEPTRDVLTARRAPLDG